MATDTLKFESFTGPHPTTLKAKEWIDEMKKWPRVEALQIMAYLIKSEACDMKDMEAYRSLDSYNYLKSGWVGKVWLYVAGEDVIYLKGDVTPSQALSDEAHTAWICMKADGHIFTAGCTCMAGLGRACSHAAAILWKVELANKKGLVGSSCTDEGAQWNRGTKRNIEPSLIEDVDFSKPKPGQPINDQRASSGRQELCHLQTENELSKHFEDSGFSELMKIPGTIFHVVSQAKPDVTCKKVQKKLLDHNHEDLIDLPFCCIPCLQFYNNFISLSEQQIAVLQSKTVTQAKSDLWFESRRLRITASTASKVPKTSRGNPSKFIFAHVHKPFSGNKYTEYGARMENRAVEQFSRKTGFSVKKAGTFVDKTNIWLSATPDGLIGNNAILEVKCPAPDKFVPKNCDLKYTDGSFSLNTSGSRGYYCQVQLTMHCTSRTTCYFYVWISEDEDYLVEVPYDSLFVSDAIQRLRKFYLIHMLPELADDYQSNRLIVSDEYKKLMNDV